MVPTTIKDIAISLRRRFAGKRRLIGFKIVRTAYIKRVIYIILTHNQCQSLTIVINAGIGTHKAHSLGSACLHRYFSL